MGDTGLSERWQAYYDAAGGTDTGGKDVQTRLASADGDKGGGKGGSGGNLKSSKGPWDAASTALGDLHRNAVTALGDLKHGQEGAGVASKGVEGLESAAMQVRVFNSWEARLTVVRDECAELKGKLQKAGNDLANQDEAIEALFKAQDTRPIPPPGGPSGSW
ncbi:hypothetical protein [Streptomyces sp. ME19-01-6]|uniref:hypothetical protein n=1 Tax=Streptomyces sp. ME19-01-6 TaxID=3028686 RepID=UPI0029A68713|nr:hypothetical protein [Streptomyces sp. ME19-01-6]MDX3232986.1 hypothetical protein [Streptomyces sp. ME19-01-6]